MLIKLVIYHTQKHIEWHQSSRYHCWNDSNRCHRSDMVKSILFTVWLVRNIKNALKKTESIVAVVDIMSTARQKIPFRQCSLTSGKCELKELIPSLRSWLWHHRLPNVTTTEAQPSLWWHLGVCGVTAMTENEVSISILSWHHKINFKLVDLVKPNCFSAAQV